VKPIEGQKRQRGQYLAAGDTDSQRKWPEVIVDLGGSWLLQQ
jgi:hypothetical protein